MIHVHNCAAVLHTQQYLCLWWPALPASCMQLCLLMPFLETDWCVWRQRMLRQVARRYEWMGYAASLLTSLPTSLQRLLITCLASMTGADHVAGHPLTSVQHPSAPLLSLSFPSPSPPPNGPPPSSLYVAITHTHTDPTSPYTQPPCCCHNHPRTHTYARTHVRTHAHMHARTHARTHTRTHPCTHTICPPFHSPHPSPALPPLPPSPP